MLVLPKQLSFMFYFFQSCIISSKYYSKLQWDQRFCNHVKQKERNLSLKRIFLHVKQVNMNLKDSTRFLEYKRFHQALQMQIHNRHLGHIVHCPIELRLILLENNLFCFKERFCILFFVIVIVKVIMHISNVCLLVLSKTTE